ncbi:type I restriction-modification system subunit S [Streptococcus pneumoniae]|nr:type I restriction-modification system subunit S [Streptococcus pneumoniae]
MKKVKLGEVLSLKKGKKATVLAEQTTLSQRYIQIDDLRNNNNRLVRNLVHFIIDDGTN